MPARYPALLLAAAALAAASAPAPAADCSNANSHQFDFWIGEWEVQAGGQVAGTNSIRPILDGCVLQETWTGAKGGAGSSFNFYDPSRGKWRQLWVWRAGTTLELEGEYREGQMILAGSSKDGAGKPVENRITWQANPDGTVRQHWETSADGGKTWSTAFDGSYRKR